MPRKLLKRLLEELNDLLKIKTSVEQKPVESEDIRDLIRDLTGTLIKITEAGYRTILVIDALNKVDESGQTTKVMLCVALTSSCRWPAHPVAMNKHGEHFSRRHFKPVKTSVSYSKRNYRKSEKQKEKEPQKVRKTMYKSNRFYLTVRAVCNPITHGGRQKRGCKNISHATRP